MRRPILVAGALCVLSVGCQSSSAGFVNPRPEVLDGLWTVYKEAYVEPEGFVLDRRLSRVTSEGQGYALLRAAWSNDPETFGRVFRWTEDNLRREDGLFAWLWDPNAERRVLDWNTATDADQEIALALILAAHNFERSDYRARAAELLRAIREREVIPVGDRWFPAAGNWAVEERIVNLSYFLPYAYPYFERVDPDEGWEQASALGYELLAAATAGPETILVADFARVLQDGTVAPLPEDSALSRDHSYDAMRIHWRVSVDCLLHQRPVACSDPSGLATLLELHGRDGTIFTRYRIDGVPLDRDLSLSFYGSILPAVRLGRPEGIDSLVSDRLSDEAIETLRPARNRYYDHNWVWFGLAAADGTIERRTPRPDEIPLRARR